MSGTITLALPDGRTITADMPPVQVAVALNRSLRAVKAGQTPAPRDAALLQTWLAEQERKHGPARRARW